MPTSDKRLRSVSYMGSLVLGLWLLFVVALALGYLGTCGWRASPPRNAALITSVLLSVAALPSLYVSRRWLISRVLGMLEGHTAKIEAFANNNTGLKVAVAAAAGLFLELMIVRYQACAVQLFAYFKNVSLLSCFLGLGIGYALEKKRPVALPLVLPLLAFQMITLHLLRQSGVGFHLQNPVSE